MSLTKKMQHQPKLVHSTMPFAPIYQKNSLQDQQGVLDELRVQHGHEAQDGFFQLQKTTFFSMNRL